MLCENESLKFLIFAHHRVMLNGIQQTLWDKKVKFIRIDGDTPPSDRLVLFSLLLAFIVRAASAGEVVVFYHYTFWFTLFKNISCDISTVRVTYVSR